MKPKQKIFTYNYIYKVFIEKMEMSFSKISGLEDNIEIESIIEGGVNGSVHIAPKQKTSSQTVVFERGIVPYRIVKDKLKAGIYLPKGITIVVKDLKNSKIDQVYFLNNPMIVKYNFGDLNATDGNIIIENIEVMHTGLTRN